MESHQPPQAEPDRCAAFRFEAGDAGRSLAVNFDPAHSGLPLDEAALRECVAKAGYATFPLFPAAIAECLRRQSGGQPFSLILGGHRDGELRVKVSADRLAADLEVQPPIGEGRMPSVDDAIVVLRNAKVVAGIDRESIVAALNEAASSAATVTRTVAHGRTPVHGDNGRLEALVEGSSDRRPHEVSGGRVDYRDLGGFQAVTPGTALVRVVPPTAGQAGVDVLGRPLPARPGKAISIRLRDSSVGPSAQDPAILEARVAGRAVVLDDGAKVEPVLQFDVVDVSTGHVQFDGTVLVKGDVRNGMKVTASGDVRVGGTVEAGRIEAGGSVEVVGGVIGHGALRDDAGRLRSEAAVIYCNGDFSARFAENARIEARGTLTLKELASHSELNAGTAVRVGDGRGKGRIIGGLTRAAHEVDAAILGSPASVRTAIEVAPAEELQQQLSTLEDELRAGKTEADRLAHALAAVAADQRAPIQEIGRRLAESLHEKLRARENLKVQLAQAERARVVASRAVYNNVEVAIAGRRLTVQDERKSVTFVLEENEVRLR